VKGETREGWSVQMVKRGLAYFLIADARICCRKVAASATVQMNKRQKKAGSVLELPGEGHSVLRDGDHLTTSQPLINMATQQRTASAESCDRAQHLSLLHYSIWLLMEDGRTDAVLLWEAPAGSAPAPNSDGYDLSFIFPRTRTHTSHNAS
jgi:hypothetical protein